MKSTLVNSSFPESSKPAPSLRVCGTVVVLALTDHADKYFSGIVLFSGKSQYAVGENSNTWVRENFFDYTGQVNLSND